MAEPAHIVVVEDEATQRQMLVDYLRRQISGSAASTTAPRCAGWSSANCPRLCMLDVGLPGEDGFALARWLRERSGRIGIIMVTAASDTVDRVVGLETGADDYIAKPFEPRELLARVKSVLRRARPAPPSITAARACAWAAGCSTSSGACWSTPRRQRGHADSERVRPAQGVRRKPEPAVDARLAAGGHRASRDGGVRPRDRPAHHPAAPQDRGRSRPSRGDPHRARGRLHVRPAEGLEHFQEKWPIRRFSRRFDAKRFTVDSRKSTNRPERAGQL